MSWTKSPFGAAFAIAERKALSSRQLRCSQFPPGEDTFEPAASIGREVRPGRFAAARGLFLFEAARTMCSGSPGLKLSHRESCLHCIE